MILSRPKSADTIYLRPGVETRRAVDAATYERKLADVMRDWQPDIDDDGRGIGVCPRCKGKARQDARATVTRLRCVSEDCGEVEA